MSKEFNTLCFLDLETTGLDPNVDEILEIGAIIVDSELNEIARYNQIVIPNVESFALKHMNDFVLDMHTKNGLLEEIEEDREDNGPDISRVELHFLKWLSRNNCKPGEIVLIGKNVGRFDRKFIQKDMPVLEWVLSHRCMELGDVVRFMREFCGIDVTAEKKESNHRAIDDCDLALEEARALRDQINKMRDLAIEAEPVQMTSIEAVEKFGAFSTRGPSPDITGMTPFEAIHKFGLPAVPLLVQQELTTEKCIKEISGAPEDAYQPWLG